MKKFIITENQLEFIVKRYLNEDARYVMSFDEFMRSVVMKTYVL